MAFGAVVTDWRNSFIEVEAKEMSDCRRDSRSFVQKRGEVGGRNMEYSSLLGSSAEAVVEAERSLLAWVELCATVLNFFAHTGVDLGCSVTLVRMTPTRTSAKRQTAGQGSSGGPGH